ncbi:hypothetical protein NUW54_g11988 [Trametes sanguinea]|uniref:Uncharacterized protein n=1 Tax=Trametes sanguinea TaxID=158606 RepID=A0ACC1N4Z8_9APHY|nr:hypothetical protein NUW54_g11988 [Trametes sanguinea]
MQSITAAFRARPLTRAFTSRSVDGFVGAVGNTPLIRLQKLSEQTGCDIVAKSELQNPGGSVKDRAALGVIRDAEERGLRAERSWRGLQATLESGWLMSAEREDTAV